MSRKIQPPRHLAQRTRRWFKHVCESFDLEEHHLRLLTLAGEAWDRCEQAREAIALHGMADFIVQGDATHRYLQTIEGFPVQTKSTWAEDSAMIFEVEILYMEKEVNLFNRLLFRWQYDEEEDMIKLGKIYLRLLAERRGNRILTALRRYRNKEGRWPESLSEIRSSLPEEILIDPCNDGPFVYKLTDDGFKLYSKGKNGIDEDAKYRSPADDWPIWPSKSRRTKKENANAQQ